MRSRKAIDERRPSARGERWQLDPAPQSQALSWLKGRSRYNERDRNKTGTQEGKLLSPVTSSKNRAVPSRSNRVGWSGFGQSRKASCRSMAMRLSVRRASVARWPDLGGRKPHVQRLRHPADMLNYSETLWSHRASRGSSPETQVTTRPMVHCPRSCPASCETPVKHARRRIILHALRPILPSETSTST